jgi:hypothetical protein
MSRTFHHGDRQIRVRSIRNNPPDLRRLARALIELAQAQMEAEAEAEATATSTRSPRPAHRGNAVDTPRPKESSRHEQEERSA